MSRYSWTRVPLPRYSSRPAATIPPHSNDSKPSYPSFLRGPRIPDEQHHQNHTDERNQSSDHHNGIEGMRCHGLPHIGEVADQLKCGNCAQTRTGTAHTAHRRDRVRVVKIRG